MRHSKFENYLAGIVVLIVLGIVFRGLYLSQKPQEDVIDGFETMEPVIFPTSTSSEISTPTLRPLEINAATSTVTSFDLLTDPDAVFSIPEIAKPSYLIPITDPTFHTLITRIAGDAGERLDIGGVWPPEARHHYSKDQPWSIDGKFIALDTSKGLILDGNTYKPVKYCKDKDGRWYSGSDPAKAHWRIDINAQELKIIDVDSCSVVKSISLPFHALYFGQGEGNTTRDGNFAIANDLTQMAVIDINAGKVGPVQIITDCGLSEDCDANWASISPSGKYAVVSSNDHLRVFDVDPLTLALTPREMPLSAAQCQNHDPSKGYIFDLGHTDMTLNPFADNEDVIVGQFRSWCPRTVDGVTMGQVVMVNLKDGKVTSLTKGENEAQAWHISARNYQRPGWVYVSYHISMDQRFTDEIIAVALDGSGRIERLAHTHTTGSAYRSEAHAVPSIDGSRILFASAWDFACDSSCGVSSNPQAYVVEFK
jgi:hypothetical protein